MRFFPLALTVAAAHFAILPTHAAEPLPTPLTAEQDHQNMMDQLGLTALRPGVDGFNPHAANAQNTDEARANPYPVLPNPLALNNGKPVATAKAWEKQRRPEIMEDFNREVYGRVPKNLPKVTWEVVKITNSREDAVPVITKQLVGHADNSAYPAISVDIRMTLTTPALAAGPVPVMMEFGFGEIPGHPSTPATSSTALSWQKQVLAKGWGYAVLVPTSFQADSGAGLTQGIIGLCNHGQPRKPDDWGALRAWAWGADRALDYFAGDSAVNSKQVGIEGLSRYGKAALVTMACDPRFAIAFVGSSGAGGAKLWRRNYGETEGNIASSGEYHWMAGNFLKYAGPLTPNDLPVDSHELIALCAPRPVFIGCGSPTVEGTWVDDQGMFQATVAAGPVYRLLGRKALETDKMPPIGTGLTAGELAFRQHEGGHTNGPNWSAFLEFAARYLHAPTAVAGTFQAGSTAGDK